ncbi:DUF1428 domain-containing protein [Psychrosphaera haliotis]|uniref:DUF1428 family protein n=1 Tax=Psychrosphaera haliotis TaxID=555083 RepID=A0A6N8F4T9_9GAMM|nr:DUF1428 domain-containing protein [Psychrosphaera haliotis]MUH71174.1 DUF1428 family protein [Psychrosphaera haliotis]
MGYIDGVIVAVETAKKQEYIDFAKGTAAAFKKHGALSAIECWGDDIPDGKVTSFGMAVKCKESESVVFSWIMWPDKETRIKAWPAIEEDEALAGLFSDMPFDGARLIYGGFEVVVNE